MLFYECSMSYKIKKESRLEVLGGQPKKHWGDLVIQDMNDTLAENSADKIEILICSAKVGKFKLVVGVDSLKKITAESLSKIFVKCLKDFEIETAKIMSMNEITPENVAKLLKQADRNVVL